MTDTTARTWVGAGLTLAALGALALLGCGDPGFDVDAARSSVDDFLGDYNAAFAAADTALIRELYVEDGRLVWLEDGVVKYRSVEDIFSSLAALPAGSRAETRFTDPQIQVFDAKHATVSAAFATTFTNPGGEGFAFGGAISMVLERNENAWQVLSGHTSTASQEWDSR